MDGGTNPFGGIAGSLFESKNAAPDGDAHGVCSVTRVQLRGRILQVHFGRLLADIELPADFLVAIAARHELQHLQLTRAQLLLAQVFDELAGDRIGYRDADRKSVV